MFYDDVVGPVCEQLNLSLIRADHVSGSGVLTERLIRHIIEEDIVVADLTGGSPEVVYGLGIRHAVGRCTVHLGEAGTVPFGAGVVPTVQFPALPLGSAEARRELTAALAEGLSGASPLMLPARILLAHMPSPAIGDNSLTPATQEEDRPGLFDLVVAAEAEMEAMVGDLAEVEAAFVDLAAMAELLTEDMLRANRPGTPTSAQLAVINRFAKAIEGPSDDLDTAAARFAGRMNVATDALGALLQWARNTPRDEWSEELHGLLDQVIEMAGELRSSADGAQEIVPVVEMFSQASRQLRKPSRKIGASLRAMFGSVAVFEEWERTARELKESQDES
ncbi:hypothetical protein ACWCOY_10630 [Streptomyces tubercidicus]